MCAPTLDCRVRGTRVPEDGAANDDGVEASRWSEKLAALLRLGVKSATSSQRFWAAVARRLPGPLRAPERLDAGVGEDPVDGRRRATGAVEAEREHTLCQFGRPLREGVGPAALRVEPGLPVVGEAACPFAERGAGDATASTGKPGVAGLAVGLDPGPAGFEGLGRVGQRVQWPASPLSLPVETMSPTPTQRRRRHRQRRDLSASGSIRLLTTRAASARAEAALDGSRCERLST